MVAPQTAHLAAAQHTAWMLINLLARTDGIVKAVQLICPPNLPLAGRVVPLAPRDVSLDDALVMGGQAIGAVPVDLTAAPAPGCTQLVVGHAAGINGAPSEPAGRRYVIGQGWWGGVSDQPMTLPEGESALPIGPYIAAALAVGEIYLHLRLPPQTRLTPLSYGWDSWTQALSVQPAPGAPTDLYGADLSGVALAGVGAVGSTWVHTLWASPGLVGDITVADADAKGIDTTNLNRSPLFGQDSLRRQKATEAARITTDCSITWQPYNGRLEAHLPVTPQVLVSAVDTNQAREALQSRYAPAMLSGSTRDLRAEVLRAGPPGIGACLRCYNPPETFTGDDELRAQADDRGPEAIRQLALDSGVEEVDVRRWLDRGHCDDVGDRLLNTLRRSAASETPTRFAVGFTSVLAGVLLAAETVKVTLGQTLTGGHSERNNVTFQFLKPGSSVNRSSPLGRDPRCPACDPTNSATSVWQQRVQSSLIPSAAQPTLTRELRPTSR